MNKGYRIVKVFLFSPPTWLVMISLTTLLYAFVQWFMPPMTITLALLGIGLLLFLLWPVMYIRSDEFYRRYNRIPEEVQTEKLEKLLDYCSPDFSKPALECLALVKTIRLEFKNKSFQSEIEAMLQNLNELTQNHIELFERSKKFGTFQQKQTMDLLLEEQAKSVSNSLVALKKFSGNLTLFDLHVKDHHEVDRELNDINTGLQEAIREIQND